MLFRSIFLIVLAVVTARISLPETLNSGTLAHFTIADFARTGMGVVICAFLMVQALKRPADEQGYKTWIYIGIALSAVALFAAVVTFGFPST